MMNTKLDIFIVIIFINISQLNLKLQTLFAIIFFTLRKYIYSMYSIGNRIRFNKRIVIGDY